MTTSDGLEFMSGIKYWLNAVLSPISLTLNGILFFLIRYKSTKTIKNYKKVLYLGWYTDFFFALWNILAQPDLTTVGPIYFMFTRGLPGYLPFPWTAWSFPISIYFIYLCVVNVPVQFIYRYLLLCWEIVLNKKMFLILVAIGSLSIAAYCYFFVYYLITRDKTDEHYAFMLNGTQWMVNGRIPYFGAFPIASFADGFYVSFSIVIVSYLIVLFCGIQIFRKMRKPGAEFNVIARRYQNQITIVMTVEAVLPFITVAFPILLDLITVLIGTPLPWAGKLAFLLGALAPLINPIVKLTVISCYRRKLIEILSIKSYFWHFSSIVAPVDGHMLAAQFHSSSGAIPHESRSY